MRIANLPTTSLPLPIQRTVPASINELSNRIASRDGLHLSVNYITDYTASFRLTKTLGYLFTVEMVGRLEEHGEALTYVTAQTRVSLFTYAVILALLVLSLLTLPSPIAGLFGLLCARMILMLVVCTPDTQEELAYALD